MIDYAHNPAAIAGLVEYVARTPAGRRICVLTVPGDRRDEDIRESGRLCAKFDYVILKEDDDRRGRARGEIAGLLREGLIDGGLDPSHIEIRHEESDAINRGLDMLGRDELLVIHADRVPATLDAVRKRTVHPS